MKKYYYIAFFVLAAAAFGYSQYAKNKLDTQLAKTGKCVEGVVIETGGTFRRPSATIAYEVGEDVYAVKLRSRADVGDVVLMKYDTLQPEDVQIVDNCH